MSCTDCPELIPNPNEGCLKPINTDCVTYNGEDIVCAEIVAGQNLNQIIEQLANNDCDLQEQIEDIVQDIEELSGNVINIQNNLEELSGSVQTQINNIPSFTCEDLSGCSIDDLLDVDVSPISGDNLIFNGIKWINQTPQIIDSFNCSDLSGCTLDSIGNVIEISSNSGDVLINNGTNWVNQSFASLFTANNGLTKTGSNIKLGGILTENTTITGAYNLNFPVKEFYISKLNTQYNSASSLFSVYDAVTYNSPSELPVSSTGVKNIYGNTLGKLSKFSGGAYTLRSGYNLSGNTILHQIELDNLSSISSDDIIEKQLHNLQLSNSVNLTNNTNTIATLNNLLIGGVYSAQINKPTITNNIGILIRDQREYGVPITNSFATYQAGTNDINRFFGEIQYSNGLTNVSDKRTKTEKSEFKDGLESLLKIRPIVFNRIEKYGNVNKDYVGIIAQELEAILPIAVETKNIEGFEDFKTFTPETLIYVCINAIKELKQEIDDNRKKDDERFTQLLSMIETQQKTIELLSQK